MTPDHTVTITSNQRNDWRANAKERNFPNCCQTNINGERKRQQTISTFTSIPRQQHTTRQISMSMTTCLSHTNQPLHIALTLCSPTSTQTQPFQSQSSNSACFHIYTEYDSHIAKAAAHLHTVMQALECLAISEAGANEARKCLVAENRRNDCWRWKWCYSQGLRNGGIRW